MFTCNLVVVTGNCVHKSITIKMRFPTRFDTDTCERFVEWKHSSKMSRQHSCGK